MRQHHDLRSLGSGRFAVVNDDNVEFALQGTSHWDSLAHFGVIEPGEVGIYYGGNDLHETESTERGARSLGIDALAGGIVARGVLLDAVEAIGQSPDGFLSDDAVITDDVIERCLTLQNIALRGGDVVAIYTGFERRRASGAPSIPCPGLDGSTVQRWRDARIMGLVADNIAVEALPTDYAIHVGVLRESGILLGELWALERLAMRCRADGRYDFMLTSAPLNIPGAFGSPANALAIR